MREILISGSDYFLDTVIGYEGEHNSTNLNIKLPSELISNDIDYYIVKFKTGKNKGVISQRLQQSGGYIVIPLVQDVTDFGVLEFQVEAWALDGDVVSRIAMTPTISRLIGKSVDSDGVLMDEKVSGLMAELQSLIANYPEKIVVERVEDLPENPEDGLDALVTGALPTGGAVKNDPFMQYFSIGGNWYKIGSEAIEYADLDAPYAGYPFRHTPSGKIVEQEHYVLPLDVPLNLYVNPVPPLTDVVQFNDRISEMMFSILPPEESGMPVNIAVLYQEFGLNENGEDVAEQYVYTPQEITFMGNSLPKGWNYISLVDAELDFTTLRPISYNEVPRMLITINYENAEMWKLAGGTYLSETPYLSEGSLYYWNGTEYVEVGGADLSAYATKEYVDENAGVTVNEVAPINGNITLDTSNIEPTNDRQYLTSADNSLLYALRGDNEGADVPHTSFILSGSTNEVTGEGSAIVAGGFNSVDGHASAIIGGAGNLASALCSATIGGQNLIASADYSVIVGENGETPADSLFAVANGTDGDNKNIAFYVGRDGVSHFDEMPVVPADRVINADNQLVDKKYVDENRANIREVSEAPESSTATGVKGETVYTNEAIYVCVDTNTWRKAALTSW